MKKNQVPFHGATIFKGTAVAQAAAGIETIKKKLPATWVRRTNGELLVMVSGFVKGPHDRMLGEVLEVLEDLEPLMAGNSRFYCGNMVFGYR